MGPGGGGLFLYWIFDQSGKLQGAADPALQGCDGNDFVTYISSGPPQSPNDIQKACYRSFYAVMAGLNRGGQLLNSYSVQLVNLPYAFKAAMNTVNAKKGADDKARQDKLNKANQNKPVF